MPQKTIIALAPTSGGDKGSANPITPNAIAEEVLRCSEAGAAIVHLHARDAAGNLTADLSCFNRAVTAIKASCDILLEASTGGLSELTAAERALPVQNSHADMASLNMGSLNFGDDVYSNALPDVRLWIDTMAAAGVKPSLEIFDTGHLETALHLIQEGALHPPCNFSFIFNVRWGMPFDPALLDLLIARLPQGSQWGALFVGSVDFSQHLAAASRGAAFVRVGFEDSTTYAGQTAANNRELVAALRETLASANIEVATPQEARQRLLAGI